MIPQSNRMTRSVGDGSENTAAVDPELPAGAKEVLPSAVVLLVLPLRRCGSPEPCHGVSNV